MKVILSRKGFDAGTGGGPSPILPDGTLLSLPIDDEDKGSPICYGQLKLPTGESYLDLIQQLPIRKAQWMTEETKAHLDPDLAWFKEGIPDWRPSFGQSNGALSHLENQDVQVGDLFLFFGWFRETNRDVNRIKFRWGARDLHVIWGYLQIGEIFDVHNTDPKDIYPWLKGHPHAFDTCYNQKKRKKNTIYIARQTLSFNKDLPGAGRFMWDKRLELTEPEERRRSYWSIKKEFKKQGIQMSGHRQEKVIDEHDWVTKWAENIILNCPKREC